jgi:hypothetical protein
MTCSARQTCGNAHWMKPEGSEILEELPMFDPVATMQMFNAFRMRC